MKGRYRPANDVTEYLGGKAEQLHKAGERLQSLSRQSGDVYERAGAKLIRRARVLRKQEAEASAHVRTSAVAGS